ARMAARRAVRMCRSIVKVSNWCWCGCGSLREATGGKVTRSELHPIQQRDVAPCLGDDLLGPREVLADLGVEQVVDAQREAVQARAHDESPRDAEIGGRVGRRLGLEVAEQGLARGEPQPAAIRPARR